MESTPHAWKERDLLEQLEWVRNLARSLVRDPALADDLVQETWIAASARRPDVADAQGLRNWLATVVRNLAINRARASERRARREAAVARPERIDDDVVTRGALHRELATAVLALEEPARSAILLRYLDGCSTAEIASRQGVSEAAARKRISRGLSDLRERLDGARNGDRGAWVVALQDWIEHSRPAQSSTVPGGRLVGRKLSLFAALGAAALLGWVVLGVRSRGAEQTGLASGIEAARAQGSASSKPSSRASALPEALHEFALIDERGAPRANFLALLLADGHCIESLRSDAQGLVASTAKAQSDELLLAREGFEPLRVVVEPGAKRQQVVVASGHSVSGVVSSAGPARSARIELTHDRASRALAGLDERARTALAEIGIAGDRRSLELREQGGFAFEGLDESWTGALELPDAWSFAAVPAQGALDGHSALLLLEPVVGLQLQVRGPLLLSGRVVAARTHEGLTTARVRVSVGNGNDWEDLELRMRVDGNFEAALPRPLSVDTNWFASISIEAGGVRTEAHKGIDWSELEAGRGLGEFEVELGRSVQVRVRDESGAAVPDAEVIAPGADDQMQSQRTDSTGAAELAGLAPSCTELRLNAAGFRPARVALKGSDPIEVTLVACNRLDVQVRAATGTLDEDISLRVESPAVPFDLRGLVEAEKLEGAFKESFELDEHGRAVLSALVPGAQLTLIALGRSGDELARRVVLAPGRTAKFAVELVVPGTALPEGGCSGRVTDPAGRPLPRARIEIENKNDMVSLRSDADGCFAIPADLCAKPIERVDVSRPGFTPRVLQHVDLRGQARFEVVLPPARVLDVSLVDADRRPVDVPILLALFEDGTFLANRIDAGRYRFDALLPGAGRVQVELGGLEFTEAFGALDNAIEIVLPATGRLELEVRGVELDPDAWTCVAIQALGRESRESINPLAHSSSGPSSLGLTLVAGRYRLQLEDRVPFPGAPQVTLLGSPREIEVSAGKTLTLTLP